MADVLNGRGAACRLKAKSNDEPEEWSTSGIGVPVPGYIEINGPWPVREVEWVEVNPIVTVHIGRLVPPRVEDHTATITQALTEARLRFVVNDGYIRVFLQSSRLL